MLKFLSPFNACYFGLIHVYRAGFRSCIINHILQHLFILLDQSTAAVIAQNARKTSLLLVRWDTLFIKSICACSGPWQEVFSDQPHMMISSTLCKMLWAFSKFHPFAPPTLSGKCSLRASRSPLLNRWSLDRSLTERFHSLLSMFHSNVRTSTSAISLLGSSTSGILYSGESRAALLILSFISATCQR